MSKRILVAENDKLNMRLFRDILTHRGYETDEHEDGFAALAAARETTPDLILTDVQLPGLSGIELTGRIKADPALAHVPVVAVTGFVGSADEARIRASGVDDFVTKPVAPSRLIAAVERNLAKSGNSLKEEERPPPWTIVEGFAKPQAKPAPEPDPAPAPPPRPADASQLLGTALAFAGAFLAVAMAPAAPGLEGLAHLYIVHLPNGAEGLSPGRPVAWQRQLVGRVVRVELDRETEGGVRAVLQLDRPPPGVDDMTAAIRHENIVGDPYVELRPGTAASARLGPHEHRAATTLRAVRTEVARGVDDLPRWFSRAAAMVDGAAGRIDKRDTQALAQALKRLATLMDAVGAGAQGLDAEARADWVGDVTQLLAEARDLFGLLRQIADSTR